MNRQLSFDALSKAQKILALADIKKSFIISKAIFSDETSNYRSPLEPGFNEKVTVRLRTAVNNIDSVIIHYNNHSFPLHLVQTKKNFDYYAYEFPPEIGDVMYYFEVIKEDYSLFYNQKGLAKEVDPHFNFCIRYNFSTPDWAKGAVMYQIFVDRFYNGDTKNDVQSHEYVYLGKPAQQIKDWEQLPMADDIRNFYGGDLKGIMDKMDYLKDLGVEALYLNPVFVSPSNHKYDIQDYDYIDPHYGVIPNDGGSILVFEKFRNKFASMYIKRTTDIKNLEASNAFMVQFIECAHQHGMKVILDGVFNHCGAFNKWLDREGFYFENKDYPPGAYREKDSPYHDYFKWYDHHNWPNNDAYDAWWGHDNHPKLNFEASRKLYDYILEIGKKWVSAPYNADGWRLDVAADLGSSESFNHQFWRDFRDAVRDVNPNAIIIAEHYGDARSWLKGDQWDTVMNYDAFMEPITWFLTGMEKHSDHFKEDMLNNGWVFESAMRYHMASMNVQNLFTAMNQLSNHDHSRFLTRTNMTVGRLATHGAKAAGSDINTGIYREAVTFQFTWPGAPTIYYGDEAGVCGWTDPDNRRTYPWGKEDHSLIELHKTLIHLRKQYKALRTGSTDYIFVDYGILCYGRWDETDQFIIILNNDNRERVVNAPIWKIEAPYNGMLEELLLTDVQGHYKNRKKVPVKNGQLQTMMPPFSSVIYKAVDGHESM